MQATESSKQTPRRVSYLSAVGGLFALISIALPWWSVSGTFASMSITLVRFGELSRGVSIGSVTITLTDTLASAVNVALATVITAGVLGFIGVKYKAARVLGILMVLIGVISFVTGVSQTIAPLGLYGSVGAFGIYVSWGLSWGFYLAVLSLLILIVSLKE